MANAQEINIGNYVWLDRNLNGLQDAAETGVANIVVRLYDASTLSYIETKTDAQGKYLFARIDPGKYYLRFVPGGEYAFSRNKVGSDDTIDSDVEVRSGTTHIINVEFPATGSMNLDAGLYRVADTAFIGDRVWHDANGDGVQAPETDTSEKGIGNVVVELYNTNNERVAETMTDIDGYYQFVGMTPGRYFVKFKNPTGYIFTSKGQGNDPSVDSDADPVTGKTLEINAVAGTNNKKIDAGMYIASSLGNKVWKDTNGDGIQNNGEPGVAGVAVTLWRDGAQVGQPTVTNAQGEYRFSNLAGGTYTLQFALPTGYVFTHLDAGTNDEIDSDVERKTGKIVDFTLTEGTNRNNLDVGLFPEVDTASIGDKVWLISPGGWTQRPDFSNAGVSGVTVKLLDTRGRELETTTTNSDGKYLFDKQLPGIYRVQFLPGETYNFTVANPAGDLGNSDMYDSDASRTGYTNFYNIKMREQNMNLDAGITEVTTCTLGDRVWNDLNRNGLMDAGEPGIAGVIVRLLDQDGNYMNKQAVTNQSGIFYIAEVPMHTNVKLHFGRPTGFVYTARNVGTSNWNIDSDADPETGCSGIMNRSGNDVAYWLDAGMYQMRTDGKADVSGKLWHDVIEAGILAWPDAAMRDQAVYLYKSDGTTLVASTMTNSRGDYQFSDIDPGNYKIRFQVDSKYSFSEANRGTNEKLDCDVITSGKNADPAYSYGVTDTIEVAANASITSIDAGVYVPITIGNLVWDDKNLNGKQDDGEPGIEGVTVTLSRLGSTEQWTTTTDGEGIYRFVDRAPGTYRVGFSTPEGYLRTNQKQGLDDTIDSDMSPVTGLTSYFRQESGQDNLNIDAGFYKFNTGRAAIGDYVWLDSDTDGEQDTTEKGMPNITVELYNTISTTPLATTKTADDGHFQFANLNPGDYRLRIIKPTSAYIPPGEQRIAGQYAGNYVTTYKNSEQVGSTDISYDSDVNTNGYTDIITLTLNQNNFDVDTGFYRLSKIGNFVWLDADGDGTQQKMDGSRDIGLAGLSVMLYRDGETTPFKTTTTNAAGSYQFADLHAGKYRVWFQLPANSEFTGKNGWHYQGDSDVNRSGSNMAYTDVIELSEGQFFEQIDAGIRAIGSTSKASIGDRVWHDVNGDGKQGDYLTEPGIVGVTVTLYNEAGDVQAEKVTDSRGAFRFDNLNPGNYRLRFGEKAGMVLTTANVTDVNNKGAEGMDSDVSANSSFTDYYTLVAGEYNATADAGYYVPMSLGDFVWTDANGDGVQQAAEQNSGVNEVVVRLYNGDGTFITETETVNGANGKPGYYQFSNLAPGAYKVQFFAPDGYMFSPPNQGNDQADSDVNQETGMSDSVTLLSGRGNNASLDAGLIPAGSISASVWHDSVIGADGSVNGIREAGESPLNMVTVTLYRKESDSSFQQLRQTTTDPSGNVSFEKLAPGDYAVKFSKDGYLLTKPNMVSDESKDSDPLPTTGLAYYTVHSGEKITNVGAGMLKASHIGDVVWTELPNNATLGTQGAGDVMLSDRSVALRDSSMNILQQKQLSNGRYNFDVLPGKYYVSVSVNQGEALRPTIVNINNNTQDSVDNDANWANGSRAASNNVIVTHLITVTENQTIDNVDIGLITPLIVDLGRDGIQTLSAYDNDARFDLLGNGQAIRSGWAGAQEGLLAIDDNHNGKIDTIHELFGGLQRGAGFDKLATFDSNADGMVDQHDAQFAKLRIWVDGNSNKQTDDGELLTLNEAGIRSLNVDFIETPILDDNGNLHLERSLATFLDGNDTALTDVYFNVPHQGLDGVTLPTLAELFTGSEAAVQATPVSILEELKAVSHLLDAIQNEIRS